MKLKFIILYSCFFIVIFTIFFSLNYFYKSLILVSNKHTYTITGEQYFNFKSLSISDVLYKYFSEEKKSKKQTKNLYRLENEIISETSFTYNSAKSRVSYNVITRNYIDENEFEDTINDIYLKPINKIVNDLESNNELYQFDKLVRNYRNQQSINYAKAYYNLVNSEFFKNYPPNQDCFYIDDTRCYDLFSKYYLNLYYSLKDRELISSTINKLKTTNDNLNNDDSNNKNLVKIINDFKSNRHLFDNFNLYFTKNNIDEIKYFQKKYDNLTKSKFFQKYMPDNFCKDYSKRCFEELSNYFNKILIKHKLESKHPFKVNYNDPKKSDFKFIDETPLVLGISLATTYIFFIFTKKLFRRKIK